MVKINKIRFYIVMALIGLFAMPVTARTSIKASLDSAYLLMGKQTLLNLDIVEPASVTSDLIIVLDSMPAEIEAIDWLYGDTVDLGNDMRQMRRSLIIQSFDSGVYTLPPVIYISGSDTLISNQVTLKVSPVDVSQKDGINDMAPISEIKSRWYDWLPDFITDYWMWIVLGLVIIAGGICAYLIFTRKVDIPLIPKKKPVPPYELAITRLNALKEEKLCEHGQEREYYTRLTDILREYIDERFGINAMEMTSSQILAKLSANPVTRPSNELMKQILEVADFVKFAKVRPLPDDNVRSFVSATRFVENTKPVEIPADTPPVPVISAENSPKTDN